MRILRVVPELMRIPPRFEHYVEDDLLAPLRARIRYHQRRLAVGERQNEWLLTPAFFLARLMMVAAGFGPGIVLYAVRGSVVEAVIATLVGYLCTAGALLPVYYQDRRRRFRLSRREPGRLLDQLLVRTAILVSVSLSLSAILYSATALGGLIRFGGSVGLLMPSIIVMSVFINVWMMGRATRLQGRRTNRDYADSALVAAYLRILNALSAEQGPRREFENRRRLVAEVDAVAELLGRALPQFVRPAGSPVDEDARRRFQRMATAQRTQKRHVYFPSDSSLDEVARSATNGLVAAAFRWWALLPQEEEAPVERRRRLGQWLLRVLTTVVVAALPLVALALSRRLGLLEGEIPPSVSAIAYGWVVVTLLNALDPAAGGKLGVMKDAAGMLKLSGGR
jgi:hypothetical protein